jgi:hypothetical protein
MSAAQGSDFKAAPTTPRQQAPRQQDPVNEVVRKLRDELGLDVVLRDLTYPPSAHNNSTSDALYDRVKFLHWRDFEALNGVTTECKIAFAGQLNTLTAKRRTEWFLQKLRDVQHDAKWLAQHRILQSPFRTNTAVPPRTPSSLQTKLRSLRRVDSGATIQSPATPTSPMLRKVMDNEQHATPASTRESSPSRRTLQSKSNGGTVNTSFTTDITDSAEEEDFGSSWTPSQVEVPHVGLHRTASGSNLHRSIAPATAVSPGRQSTKRTRSDAFKGVTDKPTKKTRQGPGSNSATPLNERFLDVQHKTKDRHHQISALEKSASIVQYPWSYDSSVSFAVSVERARVMRQTGLTSDQVSKLTDREGARAILTGYNITDFQHTHSAIWALPKTTCTLAEDPRLVLCGSLSFNPKSDKGQLFQTSVQPIRKDTKSNHLERNFGWDRFFTLTVPSFTQDLPTHLQGQGDAITSAFMERILEPQLFMGRVWRFFYTKELVKKIGGRRIIDNNRVREFSFFATCGDGIETPTSYFDFIDWILPFRENAAQTIYKLFARIALYLSRTVPTIQLQYGQIRFVGDHLANDEDEDTLFEDPVLNEKRRKKFDKDEVMTDGCARVSVGAALLIRKAMGIAERPSAFQARINGYKGMWHISDSYDTNKPEHLAIWIELRPSQAKVKVRDQDRDDSLCESDRWSFNVVDFTRPPRCSELHRDFLPVLEDRNVPRSTLLAMIHERFEVDRACWSEAMDDPARWALQRDEHSRPDSKRRTFRNGLPHAAADKTALLMDEAGYMPKECAILAEAMLLMQEHYFQRSRSRLGVVCPKSTLLAGIADPSNLLAPGEVHLSLSHPLMDKTIDKTVEESCDSFAGSDVLVGRHPMIRNSDMQKVRCVCLDELAHLKDVVVMSTRGQIPLAAKLQGGDYDGDKFWICVDERLVQPFMNAPVLEQAGLDDLGIKQEKHTLEETISECQIRTDESIECWLRAVLPFACQEKLLGAATNYLNELAYHRSLSDPGVQLVADLHDLIIDADKNGYVFNKRDFAAFREDHRNVCWDTSKIPKPAYRENLDRVKFDSGTDSKQNSLRSVIRPNGKPKNKHIFDAVIFEVLNPKIYAHLDGIHKDYVKPAQDLSCDDDLQFVLQCVPAERMDREMETLNVQLKAAYGKWSRIWASRQESARIQHWQDCLESYNSIRPVHDDDYWTSRHGPNAPDTWECFKVGVLASRPHYSKRKSFMLWVAEDTVRYLKSMSKSGAQTVDRVKAVKKPKTPKDWAQLDAACGFALPTEQDDDMYLSDFDEEALDVLDQLS